MQKYVQITAPMTSHYRWKGKIVVEKEWLMLIKTRRSMYKAVEREIKRLHSYTVSEILALPVVEGNPEYLRWLESVTRD